MGPAWPLIPRIPWVPGSPYNLNNSICPENLSQLCKMLKTCQELMSSLHLRGYLEMNYQFKTNKNNHLYGLR